jgi:ketosteroid isomerase-like protein
MSEGIEHLEGRLIELVGQYREAYQSRDLGQMMELFAEDAEVVWAAGTFRGKDTIRKVLEWDFESSPTASVRDVGIGIITVGRTAVWERVVDLTADGIPFVEQGVMIIEVDEHCRIRSLRSYYDKLGILHQIASEYPGLQGGVFRALTGYLVRQASKGLDVAPG